MCVCVCVQQQPKPVIDGTSTSTSVDIKKYVLHLFIYYVVSLIYTTAAPCYTVLYRTLRQWIVRIIQKMKDQYQPDSNAKVSIACKILLFDLLWLFLLLLFLLYDTLCKDITSNEKEEKEEKEEKTSEPKEQDQTSTHGVR